MPIIAIPACDKFRDYEESIRRAGADIRVLDRAVDRPEDVIRTVDGLLLPGGGDVLPSIYGEAAHPTYSAAEPELLKRDFFHSLCAAFTLAEVASQIGEAGLAGALRCEMISDRHWAAWGRLPAPSSTWPR